MSNATGCRTETIETNKASLNAEMLAYNYTYNLTVSDKGFVEPTRADFNCNFTIDHSPTSFNQTASRVRDQLMNFVPGNVTTPAFNGDKAHTVNMCSTILGNLEQAMQQFFDLIHSETTASELIYNYPGRTQIKRNVNLTVVNQDYGRNGLFVIEDDGRFVQASRPVSSMQSLSKKSLETGFGAGQPGDYCVVLTKNYIDQFLAFAGAYYNGPGVEADSADNLEPWSPFNFWELSLYQAFWSTFRMEPLLQMLSSELSADTKMFQ